MDNTPITLKRRVTQTRLHSEGDAPFVAGNCVAACVASVFDMAIEDVEETIQVDGPVYWWITVERFFQARGWLVQRLTASEGAPRGLSFASGVSSRGIRHCCVAIDGVVVHDPHPSNEGLTEITDFWVFTPWIFPSALQTR